MLRVISFFLLLIISQISHAETIAATAVSEPRYSFAFSTYYSAKFCQPKCSAADVGTIVAESAAIIVNRNIGTIAPYSLPTTIGETLNIKTTKNYPIASLTYASGVTSYSCPSGYTQSDASGVASSTGEFCTKDKSACADSAGLTLTLWVSATNPPSSGCYAGCTVSADIVVGFPDRVGEYQNLPYVSKDEVCSGVFSDVDAATATAANQAAADAKAAADKAAADAQAAADKAAADAAAAQAAADAAAAQAAADAADLEAQKTACGSAGYTTGTVDGKTVVACKVPDSPTTPTDTASSASGTSGSSSGDTSSSPSGDTSGSTSGGASGGTSGSTSGGTSGDTSSDTPTTDDPSTDEEESDGSGGDTFTAPDAGTDYLKDVFGDSDLTALKTKNEELKKQVTQKMTDVKSVFNLGSLSVNGSISNNNQQIKGSTVDLSGKSLFDQLSVLSAIFYLCAIAAAIYIVLGGRK